jgi:membrane protein required for beta-lactamase induction
MSVFQFILVGGLAALLVGSWLCGFMFFRRFRDQHHARWQAEGQPDPRLMSQAGSDALPLSGKSRWKKLAEESGDVILQRLVFWWRVMEWLFVLGVLAAIASSLT